MNSETYYPVPDEVKAIIDPINADLNYNQKRGYLVPYLEDPQRTPHDWRCRLVDKDQNTLVDHLRWQHLERHTISMVLYGFERQAKLQFKCGQQDAVNRLHEHNQRVLGFI